MMWWGIIGYLGFYFLLVFGTIMTLNLILKRNKISFRESLDLVDLPIVTFKNNNIKLNFLLDTGSNVSYINKEVLSQLQYETTNRIDQFMGASGEVQVVNIIKMSLLYKDKKDYIEYFSIADLSKAFNAIKSENGVTIHGILGNSFFLTYGYILDFEEKSFYNRKLK